MINLVFLSVVRQSFAVREDSVLAHNLQEQESKYPRRRNDPRTHSMEHCMFHRAFILTNIRVRQVYLRN